MRRKFISACLLWLPLCGLLWSAPAVSVAAEPILSERRLPTDVVAYVTVKSVKDLKEDWQKTFFAKLFQEQELADFWKEVQAQLDDASGKLQQQVGLTLNEILSIPQGEMTLAVMQTGGKPVALAALVDFGENKDAIQKLLDKAAKSLEEEGAKRSEQEYEDTQIIVFTQTQKADDDDDAKKNKPVEQTLAYFIKESQLVAASSVDSLKAILTRWDGKHEKTFAEKPVFSYLKERCRNEGDTAAPITWYIDPIGIVKAAINAADNPQAGMVLGFLPQLGIDKLKAIGGTLDLAEGEYDSISRTLVYIEPPPSGVMKVFDFPATTMSPSKWVPAKASTYFGLNWNIEEAFNAVATIYDQFTGQQGGLEKFINELANADEGPKVNLKKDIIDQLTGLVQVVGQVDDSDEEGGENYVFGLGVKDEAAFKKTLAAISKTPGFPGKLREFRGESIYEISLGGGDDDDAGNEEDSGDGKAAIAVTQKALMIATDVTLLEEILRADADQDSLADSDQYKQIAKFFPNQVSSISFSRADVQVKALYEAMRSGNASDVLGEDVKIDFSKLPPFQTVQKYLTPTGTYMKPDERGYFISNFSLREPNKSK